MLSLKLFFIQANWMNPKIIIIIKMKRRKMNLTDDGILYVHNHNKLRKNDKLVQWWWAMMKAEVMLKKKIN